MAYRNMHVRQQQLRWRDAARYFYDGGRYPDRTSHARLLKQHLLRFSENERGVDRIQKNSDTGELVK